MEEYEIKELIDRIDRLEGLYVSLLSSATIEPQIAKAIREVVGSVTLVGLRDVSVDLGTLSNEQPLKYRASDKKWYNGTDNIA